MLEGADGNRFAAFSAAPEDGADVGVVLLRTCAGSTGSTKSWPCASPSEATPQWRFDYFGRTAGRPRGTRSSSTWSTSSRRRPRESSRTSAPQSLTFARRGARTIFTVGFCFGGRNSWLAAAAGHGLAGAIGFYGRPGEGRDGTPGPTQKASEIGAPILALQAGDDATSPPPTTPRSTRRSTRRASSTKSSRTTAHRIASSTASRRSSRQLPTTRGPERSRSSPPTRVELSTRGGATCACRRKRRCGVRSTPRPPHAGPRGVRLPGPSDAHS